MGSSLPNLRLICATLVPVCCAESSLTPVPEPITKVVEVMGSEEKMIKFAKKTRGKF